MALAHTIENKVERAYRRGDLFDRRRRLMDDWADYCASGGAAGDNVTPIRKAQADKPTTLSSETIGGGSLSPPPSNDAYYEIAIFFELAVSFRRFNVKMPFSYFAFAPVSVTAAGRAMER